MRTLGLYLSAWSISTLPACKLTVTLLLLLLPLQQQQQQQQQ